MSATYRYMAATLDRLSLWLDSASVKSRMNEAYKLHQAVLENVTDKCSKMTLVTYNISGNFKVRVRLHNKTVVRHYLD